jgi:uncharacterized LabA/DUF88 family protein
MDLLEFKKYNICQQISLSVDKFPRIIAFIDFANVDHWFDDDQYDLNGQALSIDQLIGIDLKKLREFLYCFAEDIRFYYGHDPSNLSFITAAKHTFGKHRVFTKRIQQVRHDLTPLDSVTNTRVIHSDDKSDFVLIPKCNFDVEICVDAIRLVDTYDTICLLSSDADFAALIRYLKSKHYKKKIILIKGGRIDSSLGKLLDLKIDASQVKSYIVQIKQKPGIKPGPANS